MKIRIRTRQLAWFLHRLAITGYRPDPESARGPSDDLAQCLVPPEPDRPPAHRLFISKFLECFAWPNLAYQRQAD